MEVDCDGGSSARRRRQRRLRSWWRHERMSIACALAEAHHHSAPKVGAEQHYASWRQKATSAGARPGVLNDPAPQGAVTVGYVAAPGPLLSTPSLADTAAEAVDARTVKFLLQKTLARKKEEEEERRKEVAKQQEEKYEAKMKLLNDRVRHDLPLTEVEWAAWRQWMGLVPSSSARRRKRKKRRNSSWPRSTSATAASSFWCAHRRLRQRHVQGWFSFLALCSLWLQTGPDARHHGRYDQEGWFLSTAPRIWQSLVRCSLWFDSGYILRQSTAAFVGGAFCIQRNAWFDSGFARWLLGAFRIERNAWFDSGSGR